MRLCQILLLSVVPAMACLVGNAQQVIALYKDIAPGSSSWYWTQGESNRNQFNTKIVYNVSRPSLTVFAPSKGNANGTAVVIAPGGAFHTLSIENEGEAVARWLAKKGITAFVLSYRLVHSVTSDPVSELIKKLKDFPALDRENDSVVNMAIADGLAAIAYVRTHAKQYHINPGSVGIMGFSAGGTLTMGTVFNSDQTNRPDFAAPVYLYLNALKNQTIPANAPPLFICAASDDQFGFATHSTALYNAWIQAGKEAELHMYLKGGHGFGLRKQNLPTDHWIERFTEWLALKGWMHTSR